MATTYVVAEEEIWEKIGKESTERLRIILVKEVEWTEEETQKADNKI